MCSEARQHSESQVKKTSRRRVSTGQCSENIHTDSLRIIIVNKDNRFTPPDLTKEIVLYLQSGPSALGGFADIWQGDWKQENKGSVKVRILYASVMNHRSKVSRRLR